MLHIKFCAAVNIFFFTYIALHKVYDDDYDDDDLFLQIVN